MQWFSFLTLILAPTAASYESRKISSCTPLNPQTDSIHHPDSDPECSSEWPGYKYQRHCDCEFLVATRDAQGCPINFNVLCALLPGYPNNVRPRPVPTSYTGCHTAWRLSSKTSSQSAHRSLDSQIQSAYSSHSVEPPSSHSSHSAYLPSGSYPPSQSPSSGNQSIRSSPNVKMRLIICCRSKPSVKYSDSKSLSGYTNRPSPPLPRLTTTTTMTTIATSVTAMNKQGDDQCTFRCSSGKCLNNEQVCNGVVDCKNGGADESSHLCPGIVCHGYLSIRCPKTNVCVPREAFCDGIDDCGDGFDELKEVCMEQVPCPEGNGWFRCSISLRCIPDVWICDGHRDCEKVAFADISDETELQCHGKARCWNKIHLFRCQDNIQCVSRNRLCNGRKDCADNSDEEIECGKRSCTLDEFECKANRPYKRKECISATAMCDGTADCIDGADESVQLCGWSHSLDKCNGFEFKCVSNLRCVPLLWRCDGQKDCLDGSDEQACGVRDYSCGPRQYACERETRCIPEEWLCDGQPDCKGQDDERSCPTQNFIGPRRLARR